MIVSEYQDVFRTLDQHRFMRIAAIAAGKKDPDSHIYYADNPEIDRETLVFGHHLITGLKPYRKLLAQFARNLPELEIRPSMQKLDDYIYLSAYIRCRDRDHGPGIREIFSDYLGRAAKGRAHLRVVKNDPFTPS